MGSRQLLASAINLTYKLIQYACLTLVESCLIDVHNLSGFLIIYWLHAYWHSYLTYSEKRPQFIVLSFALAFKYDSTMLKYISGSDDFLRMSNIPGNLLYSPLVHSLQAELSFISEKRWYRLTLVPLKKKKQSVRAIKSYFL